MKIADQPDLPRKGLWQRHPCHDHIDVLTTRLETMTIERVFEDGLHEFITDFLTDIARLGGQIERTTDFSVRL
jgi:uncharacterized alpha-E superfamily protein